MENTETKPNWVLTPSYFYSLFVGDADGSVEQTEVTLAEFIALKRELARMRGLKAQPEGFGTVLFSHTAGTRDTLGD